MTFTPLPFGNSDEIAPGMIVLACGNPYGLGTTVSRGIISARERKLVDSGINLIQTDASIFPGNSGGPLVNIRGEIIGINKSVLPNAEKNYAGIGFAIPSNLVMHSFEQICKHGRPMKGYLGLDIVRNTPPLRSFLDYHEAGGAVINIVKHGSPAEQAGLQTGDVILSFNEVPIQTDEEVKERIENLSIGDKFWLKVWRKGQKMNVTLKVGDSILKNVPSPWEDFMEGVGMHLRELTAEEQSIGARGLLVIQVNPKKSVGQILQAGDMVLTCCKKRLLPWWAWRNGSIGIWKAAHFTAASRPNLRTSSPPFTASRWRIFWTTTPCFCTGAEETSSADTGRQKAGTVSSLPTMPR